MKYCFIHDHRSAFRVKKMCRIFNISRSGYYGWKRRQRSVREKENEKLVYHIREAYALGRKAYGSPRITKELKTQGIACGKNRIARLMRINGIRAKMKRRYKVTTHSRHTRPVVPNLLTGRTIDAPDTAWVSDITYIRTYEGWLYLAVVLDIFSRSVVGWSMSERLTDDLTVNALMQALLKRNPASDLIFHSDRGSQYASMRFRQILSRYGILQSMSGKGNCYDNAYAESFFGTLKTELGHRYESRSVARRSIFEYIEVFYNRIRRHSALNCVSPLEYERNHMVA
jgi:putative transposase